MITLTQGERITFKLETSTGKLYLTNLKVWHGNESSFTNLRVEDVGSVAAVQLTHRWLLWATGGCIALAGCLVWMAAQGIAYIGIDNYRRLASLLLFASAFLVMAFGTKRFTQLRIASSLGVIEVRVRSMIRKEIIQFVRELENAKAERSQHGNPAIHALGA
jgi:hypothetical protein